MIDDYRRLLLKAPTKPPLPGAQSIRCSVCQESLTVCKGPHGPAQPTQQRIGGDVGDLGYHEPGCTYPQDSCWCKVGREWTI